ncbi:hypothetical protein DFP72DRAFT_1139363 [Ephemerocybe angulata]|uniref:Uncharacterized protein n=1 Tax=Ephemerocybe angulata TaxID=980116 RepID=A0A8H6M069_9AGAR|nr:hypothetical protein DFP72DRAFT_1139363 [Tulosesus angulatus]
MDYDGTGWNASRPIARLRSHHHCITPLPTRNQGRDDSEHTDYRYTTHAGGGSPSARCIAHIAGPTSSPTQHNSTSHPSKPSTMRFTTTVTLFSAVILSGSSVLAAPIPATSIELTSLDARDLSYEPTVDARAFEAAGSTYTEVQRRELELELVERGLRDALEKMKGHFFGGNKDDGSNHGAALSPGAGIQGRGFEDSEELLERGLRDALEKLKGHFFGGDKDVGGNQGAALSPHAPLQRRGLEGSEELLGRKRYFGRRSLSADDRDELVQRGIRAAFQSLKEKVFGPGSNQPAASPDAGVQRRELEREIVGRAPPTRERW